MKLISIKMRLTVKAKDYPEAMKETSPLKRVLALKEAVTDEYTKKYKKLEYVRFVNGTIMDILEVADREGKAPDTVTFDVLYYKEDNKSNVDRIYYQDEWR